MKKITRRVLGVAAGLVLGWIAQGYFQSLGNPVMAAQQTAVATDQPGDGQHHDAPFAGAELLVPGSDDVSGLRWGVYLTAELFAMAFLCSPITGSTNDTDDAHH